VSQDSGPLVLVTLSESKNEKASLAPRTVGERAPLAHAKSARPAHPLGTQTLLAASAKSHRKLQNVRKVRTVL